MLCKPLERKGLSNSTINVIAASWRASTKKQYNVYLRKWKKYCKNKGISYLQARSNDVLEFLSELFHKENSSYSVINCARSALSSFLVLDDAQSVGDHPLISRFVKGVFHLRPPTPRYEEIWDVNLVLNLLRKWAPANSLNLKYLTLKLCTLTALISAQRVQSIHYLHLDQMAVKEGSAQFTFKDLLKHDRPGKSSFTLKMKAYPPDRRLCVVNYLRHYVQRTKNIRGNERYLFVSFKKPHGRVSAQTIARWIKDTLCASGIDTSVYKAQSTRAASTSAANNANLPIGKILAQAGWSSERTFRKFYNKPIEIATRDFSHTLLRASHS